MHLRIFILLFAYGFYSFSTFVLEQVPMGNDTIANSKTGTLDIFATRRKQNEIEGICSYLLPFLVFSSIVARYQGNRRK